MCYLDICFWVVVVDVKDWCFDYFCDVGVVFVGFGIFGCGGEVDLVVDDDVDGVVDVVVW